MTNSWGNFPTANPEKVEAPFWRDSVADNLGLAYGLGRSYGDVCLNNGSKILKTHNLDRIIEFNSESGVLTVEAGISFESILNFIIPFGWFLPVSPGTKFVTLGGAIANDIHGKNHHLAGTIGRHVEELTLVRSDGVFQCSRTQNIELFNATVGGIGLTGIITVASIKLKKIQSSNIEVQQRKFSDLAEFDAFSDADMNTDSNNYSRNNAEYTVAWIDCICTNKNRGIFISGNHSTKDFELKTHSKPVLDVPFFLPSYTLNAFTVRAFNEVYFHLNARKDAPFITHYNPFFYPLDGVNNWNRIYGKGGFIQLQVVVPELEQIKAILKIVKTEELASFLAVLKKFGSLPSPGILSFPRTGYTLCLDFITRSETIPLIKRLCDLTIANGGALYPAKDAVMSKDNFIHSYPNYNEWLKYKDHNITSNFFRRIFEI